MSDCAVTVRICQRCKVAPMHSQHPNCKYCETCAREHGREQKRKDKNAKRRAEQDSRPVLPCVRCPAPRHSKDPRCLYCEECYWVSKREKQIARIKATPETKRARERLRTYGLTDEKYQAMFTAQQGCCATCKISFTETLVHVDHCHETGRVRGLLCRECNLVAGKIEKLQRKQALLSMLQYLGL